MRKIVSLVLIIFIIASCGFNAFATNYSSFVEIDRSLGLITDSFMTASVNSTGLVQITLYCDSESAATYRIKSTSYIEKLTNGNWVRMTLEDGSTFWINNANGKYMDLVVEQQLTAGKGQYRITTQFEVISGMGSESSTHTSTVTYN